MSSHPSPILVGKQPRSPFSSEPKPLLLLLCMTASSLLRRRKNRTRQPRHRPRPRPSSATPLQKPRSSCRLFTGEGTFPFFLNKSRSVEQEYNRRRRRRRQRRGNDAQGKVQRGGGGRSMWWPSHQVRSIFSVFFHLRPPVCRSLGILSYSALYFSLFCP